MFSQEDKRRDLLVSNKGLRGEGNLVNIISLIREF